MKCDYGYVRGTVGLDGDHCDVYLGGDPEAIQVFAIDQMKMPECKELDEQKFMMGFRSKEDAVKTYLSHYPTKKILGKVKAIDLEDFIEQMNDKTLKGKKIAMTEHLERLSKPNLEYTKLSAREKFELELSHPKTAAAAQNTALNRLKISMAEKRAKVEEPSPVYTTGGCDKLAAATIGSDSEDLTEAEKVAWLGAASKLIGGAGKSLLGGAKKLVGKGPSATGNLRGAVSKQGPSGYFPKKTTGLASGSPAEVQNAVKLRKNLNSRLPARSGSNARVAPAQAPVSNAKPSTNPKPSTPKPSAAAPSAAAPAGSAKPFITKSRLAKAGVGGAIGVGLYGAKKAIDGASSMVQAHETPWQRRSVYGPGRVF